MQSYVVHRLLNQRARLVAPPAMAKKESSRKEPEPDSDTYDTDLESGEEDASLKPNAVTEKEKENENKTGVGLYQQICTHISSPPQTSIMQNLSSKEVKLSERHLGPTNLTGFTAALLRNSQVTKVDLSNNNLGFDGGKELMSVLLANNTVKELNLSSNGFGGNGVSAFIAKLMQTNRTIKDLNISSNSFTDEDAKYLASGIESNDSLVKLDLSHNAINEEGATYIGKGIAANDTLEEIDLSWNSIRKKGAVLICQALKRNVSVKKLNLAWNGFGYEGALAVRDALSVNKHLIELDISNNRINWEGAQLLAEFLECNCYLEVLKAGSNPLTTTGCLDIIDAMDGNANSGIRILDLSDVPVVKNFVIMANKIKQNGRAVEFIHGEVVPHHDVLGERLERKIHPMQKIINYLYEKEMRPLELLRSFDKDGKFELTEDEFLQKLMAKGIEIKSWEKDDLISFIVSGGYGGAGGTINYKKLVDSVLAQIEYERNVRIKDRERAKAIRRYNDQILHATLPPLNVDAALVQITGIKTADAIKNPESIAVTFLADAITERSNNSFDSKMAMARNVKITDNTIHKTPRLITLNDKEQTQAVMSGGKPRSYVIMSSPLNRVKARKSRSHSAPE